MDKRIKNILRCYAAGMGIKETASTFPKVQDHIQADKIAVAQNPRRLVQESLRMDWHRSHTCIRHAVCHQLDAMAPIPGGKHTVENCDGQARGGHKHRPRTASVIGRNRRCLRGTDGASRCRFHAGRVPQTGGESEK